MRHDKPQEGTRKPLRIPSLSKAPTGIRGLDELTGGGLPQGRPPLMVHSRSCRAGRGVILLTREQVAVRPLTVRRVLSGATTA
jgi:hypothetical protein